MNKRTPPLRDTAGGGLFVLGSLQAWIAVVQQARDTARMQPLERVLDKRNAAAHNNSSLAAFEHHIAAFFSNTRP